MDQPNNTLSQSASDANYAYSDYSQYTNQPGALNQPQNLPPMQQSTNVPPSDPSHYSNYSNYSNSTAPISDTAVLIAPTSEEEDRRSFYTSKYIDSLIPSKWKARLEVFFLIGGLLASEALDITKRENLTIKSCSLDEHGDYSLQNCVNYNVTDCTDGVLEVDYKRFNGTGLITLFILLGVIIVLFESSVIQLQLHKNKILKLLEYQLFVHVKLRRFIINTVLLIGISTTYLVVKYSVFKKIATDDYLFCDDEKIYLKFEDTYGSSFRDICQTMIVMGAVFYGPIKSMIQLYRDFYRDMSFSGMIEWGFPHIFDECKRIQYVELDELDKHLLLFLKVEFPKKTPKQLKRIDLSTLPPQTIQKFILELQHQGVIKKMKTIKETGFPVQNPYLHYIPCLD